MDKISSIINFEFLNIKLWVWVLIVVSIVAINLYMINPKSSQIETMDSGAKIKFMNFNTRWCGYSKQFQPEWDAFHLALKNHNDIQVLDVKCDDKDNEKICETSGIAGFPTVIIDVNGTKIPYEGERTKVALIEEYNRIKKNI